MNDCPYVPYDQNIKKGNGFPSDLLAVLQPTLSYHHFLGFFRIVGAMQRKGISSSSNREQSESSKDWMDWGPRVTTGHLYHLLETLLNYHPDLLPSYFQYWVFSSFWEGMINMRPQPVHSEIFAEEASICNFWYVGSYPQTCDTGQSLKCKCSQTSAEK